jgi:uncharacterized protein YigA (DUF484 family)
VADAPEAFEPPDLPRLPPGWAAVFDERDRLHRDGHTRLRQELERLNGRVENNYSYFSQVTDLHRSEIATLKAIASSPVDATRLVLSTKSILGLVGGCLIIAASYWTLSAKIDSQQQLTKIQIESIQEAVKQANARYELLRIEVQTLKETMIAKGKTP